MKMKYRFLFPTVAVVALGFALFGSLLISVAFHAQLAFQRQAIAESLSQIRYATQAAYTNYAIQGIRASDDRIREIVRAQGGGAEITRAEEPRSESIWLEGRTLYAEAPLALSDANYCLRVSSDLSSIYDQRALLLRCYHIAYAAALLVTGVTLLILVRHVTRPLEALKAVSSAFSHGELDRRAPVEGTDEIGALAAAFNGMADEISGQLNRQSRFIDALTHEMRTPLTAMIGHAETIRMGNLSDEEVLAASQTILREGKRLSALSDKMTEWVLLKHHALAPRDLSTMMLWEDTVSTFEYSLGDRRLKLNPAAQDAIIRGDGVLMAALLANLVRNALNASAKEITFHCEFTDPHAVRMVVSDDGCGMSEAELSRITEPFYRVDKARSRANGGMGLGLALCKEIAQRHDAILRFESAPGRGTSAIIDMAGRRPEWEDPEEPD